MEWQPIKTAPRMKALLVRKMHKMNLGYEYDVAEKQKAGWVVHVNGRPMFLLDQWEPTEWAPLPNE